ncbi:MAG: DNA polymerase III subunit delta [bacterium]
MEILYSKLETQPLPEDKCFVLSGGDIRLRGPILEKIRAFALGDARFDEETFEGKSATASSILASAQTIPFEAPRRLIMIREAQRLPLEEAQRLANALGYATKVTGSKKKKVTDTPVSILPDLACVVFICVDEQNDDTDLQKKLKAVTTLLETAAKECATLISFPELKGDSAAKQLLQMAEAAGKKLSPDASKHLMALVDGDYGIASAELEKALFFVGSQPEVTEYDLDQVVTPSRIARIFSLVDAIAEGRLGDALSQLRLMLGGTESPQTVALRSVLPLMGRQFRLLWQARALMDIRYPLSRTQNVPTEVAELLPREPNVLSLLARQPYFEGRIKKQAGRFTLVQLRKALRLLLETDMALKGISPSLNANDTLERLVVALCGISSSNQPAPSY